MVSNGLFIIFACLTKGETAIHLNKENPHDDYSMRNSSHAHAHHRCVVCVIHFAQVLFILIIIHCASCNNIMQFMRTLKKPIYLFKMFFVVHMRRQKKRWTNRFEVYLQGISEQTQRHWKTCFFNLVWKLIHRLLGVQIVYSCWNTPNFNGAFVSNRK